MKIEVGKRVTFIREVSGAIVIRSGEIICIIEHRTPSGKYEDYATVEYAVKGGKIITNIKASELYSSKLDAALAIYKKVAQLLINSMRNKD